MEKQHEKSKQPSQPSESQQSSQSSEPQQSSQPSAPEQPSQPLQQSKQSPTKSQAVNSNEYIKFKIGISQHLKQENQQIYKGIFVCEGLFWFYKEDLKRSWQQCNMEELLQYSMSMFFIHILHYILNSFYITFQ